MTKMSQTRFNVTLVDRETGKNRAGEVTPLRPLSLEWIAGFFDGEGCICITKSNGYPFVQVIVTQKESMILEEIKNQHGGKIYFRKNPTGGVHQLCFSRQAEAKEFLEAILPHLRLKHLKAAEALEIIGEPGHRRQGKRAGVIRTAA